MAVLDNPGSCDPDPDSQHALTGLDFLLSTLELDKAARATPDTIPTQKEPTAPVISLSAEPVAETPAKPTVGAASQHSPLTTARTIRLKQTTLSFCKALSSSADVNAPGTFERPRPRLNINLDELIEEVYDEAIDKFKSLWSLDYVGVHAQIKRTTSHIESRYVDCGDEFGGGVSELLSPFITRHGPGGNKEVTIEGVESDARPARFTFRLHEDEQEEFDGPGTHDACIEVCTQFAEVIVHQLLHRLGDLEGMSGARLFTPDEYPLDRGERNRRCMEWLESLVTLFKADQTEEILPGKPMFV
ncbi:unnamed protein product [Closterium sp. NIES-64]|nr:unnamed protein product [Closterium sp. NIES-64]